MADYKYLLIEKEGPLTILTLNRPERMNALGLDVLKELHDCLLKATNDEDCRAMLLTGAGKGFCAGADMDDWDEKVKNYDAQNDPEMAVYDKLWTDYAHACVQLLKNFLKPLIVAVNGAAVGLGCDVTLTADRRFASTKAKFGEFYIRRGYCPDGGGTWLLPRVIGWPKATDMILTGRLVKAEEAKELGIVDVLCEPEELMDKAKAYALELANGPTIGIMEAKRNLMASWFMTLENEMRLERQGGLLCQGTPDEIEGVAAFMEGREPHYTGKWF